MIMDRIELQQLRDLPIEGVAERLGLEVRRHTALCPFHNDHHPSLSFNVRKNTFRCFVCDAHGGTLDLVMRTLHKDFREACEWLSLTPLTPSPRGEGGADGQHACFDASRYERFFERPWLSDAARRFLFDERRLDPRVVRWCRLTSWRDRQGIDWLQIPYYDRDGRLTGIQNRNLNPSAQPRFRFPRGAQCGIYNLPVLNRLRDGEPLWIAEGASDCWATRPSPSPPPHSSRRKTSPTSGFRPPTCTWLPTATSPASASSSSCSSSCPTSSTTCCHPDARTTATTILN